MGTFDAARELPPAETIIKIKEIVTAWWPTHADGISRAFNNPQIQEWAYSIAFSNPDERLAKIIFGNLLKPYMTPRAGWLRRLWRP